MIVDKESSTVHSVICDFHDWLTSGQNPSLYCAKCVIEFPDKSEVKSKSRLSIPLSFNNDNPIVSFAPEPGLKEKQKEPRGTFKVLRDRGIKIVNYQERGWRKEKKRDE
jgi:hypothetical protein